jgi:ribose transport system substrate-binding protein
MEHPNHSRYIVKSLVHASHILSAFRSEGEVLRLRDVVARTGFNKVMCFRILYTLHSCGFLEKVGENQYRILSNIRPNRRYRLGYAAQGQDSSFPREVTVGLTRAAESSRVELVVVDNRYDAKMALRNADQLVREEVDLAIEFQADEAVAPAIAGKFMEASIPMIAVDIPHPGATYFGANNYEAGLIGGRCLGRWANKHWQGEVDEIIMLEISRAGSLPQARIRGMLAGLNETMRRVESSRVVHLHG